MTVRVLSRRDFLGLMATLPAVSTTSGTVVRPFHSITIAKLATTKHTHAQLVGTVEFVAKEQDGDWHIRLTDGGATCVAEIIFEHPLPVPALGEMIRVRGITRRDPLHGWFEIHPVIGWEPLTEPR